MFTEYTIRNVDARIEDLNCDGAQFPSVETLTDMNLDLYTGATLVLVENTYELREETRRMAATVSGWATVQIRHKVSERIIETRTITYSRKNKHYQYK